MGEFMTKRERINKAQDIALEERGFEYIMEVHDAPDFVEVIGNIGGDVEKYRVYNDQLV